MLVPELFRYSYQWLPSLLTPESDSTSVQYIHVPSKGARNMKRNSSTDVCIQPHVNLIHMLLPPQFLIVRFIGRSHFALKIQQHCFLLVEIIMYHWVILINNNNVFFFIIIFYLNPDVFCGPCRQNTGCKKVPAGCHNAMLSCEWFLKYLQGHRD